MTAFGGPGGYFSLAITAFGAFEFILPKYFWEMIEDWWSVGGCQFSSKVMTPEPGSLASVELPMVGRKPRLGSSGIKVPPKLNLARRRSAM